MSKYASILLFNIIFDYFFNCIFSETTIKTFNVENFKLFVYYRNVFMYRRMCFANTVVLSAVHPEKIEGLPLWFP